jgi:transcriptional regulator
MYVPGHFDASDVPFCHDLIRAYPFACLVTTRDGEMIASHLPFLLDANRGPRGTLIAHVARANPQHEALAAGATALVAFTGPHAYVSPSWYETHPAVPTWNYCVVHAYGTARIIDDPGSYLARLATTFDSQWRFESLPTDYQTKMIRGIVAFDIEITVLEGKAKLSQNRSAADVAAVIGALESSDTPLDRDIAQWMKRSRPLTG